ncbi:MAG: FAD-dependent oxidoreductase [Gammaproteobacteria bacterium]|nr:FAD-dependent oxidoreductase [Gammaproteobacteria bacterium]
MSSKKAKSSKLVIVGSGLAGYTLAREVRRHDKIFPITVITADTGEYYSKPQLSNALSHQKSPDQLALFSREKYAQQFNLDIKASCFINSIIEIENIIGSDYSHLVLATGANPVNLPELQDAHVVNDLDDYRNFRGVIQGQKKITIVGAGLVGCEFANDLISAGYEVTVIAPENYPLASLIPEQAGLALKAALAEKGVNWQLGRYFQPEDNQGIILSAVGLRPNVALAKSANLAVNRGILVSEYLETSQEGIYALGDCAEVFGRVLPYVAPLTLGARALAKTILGERTAVEYPVMPVHIKTSLYPVVVTPVEKGENRWEIESDEDGLTALCYTPAGKLVGFCITGRHSSKSNEFLARI